MYFAFCVEAYWVRLLFALGWRSVDDALVLLRRLLGSDV